MAGFNFTTKISDFFGNAFSWTNPLPTAEIQIAGVQDDGTPEGVIRSKLVSGELVKVGFDTLNWSRSFSGSAAANASQTMTSDGDGDLMSVNMSTVAGLGTNGVTLNFFAYGTIVGIRFRRDSATPPFSVLIDGVAYGVDQKFLNAKFANGSAITDREVLYIVAKDLPDRCHDVNIVLYPDATVAKTLVVYGFLVERRAGYRDTTPKDILYGAGSLTALLVNVSTLDATSDYVRGLKSILYYNSDSVSRTVTIAYNSITIATLTIASLSSARFDLSTTGVMPGGSTAALQHQADATTVVKFVCIGSFV